MLEWGAVIRRNPRALSTQPGSSHNNNGNNNNNNNMKTLRQAGTRRELSFYWRRLYFAHPTPPRLAHWSRTTEPWITKLNNFFHLRHQHHHHWHSYRHFGESLAILRCQLIVAMSFPWKYQCFYVVDDLNQRDLGRGGWLRDPSGSDGGSPAEQITTDLTINWFTHLQGGRKIFIFHLDF